MFFSSFVLLTLAPPPPPPPPTFVGVSLNSTPKYFEVQLTILTLHGPKQAVFCRCRSHQQIANYANASFRYAYLKHIFITYNIKTFKYFLYKKVSMAVLGIRDILVRIQIRTSD
jgi:hypothetical protein